MCRGRGKPGIGLRTRPRRLERARVSVSRSRGPPARPDLRDEPCAVGPRPGGAVASGVGSRQGGAFLCVFKSSSGRLVFSFDVCFLKINDSFLDLVISSSLLVVGTRLHRLPAPSAPECQRETLRTGPALVQR